MVLYAFKNTNRPVGLNCKHSTLASIRSSYTLDISYPHKQYQVVVPLQRPRLLTPEQPVSDICRRVAGRRDSRDVRQVASSAREGRRAVANQATGVYHPQKVR